MVQRNTVAWFSVAGIGLALFLALHNQAMPELAVELKVTAKEARERGAAFLKARGIDVAGYRSAVIFETDSEAMVYLQRTLGLSETNALSAGQVPLHGWTVRWFRPLEVREQRVQVTPTGEIGGFEVATLEGHTGLTPPESGAKSLAEHFLGEQHVELAEWQPVEVSTSHLEDRSVHKFIWRRTDFQAADAELRIKVVVRGNEVVEYKRYLWLPESFRRTYAAQQGQERLISTVSGVLLSVVLALCALVVFMRAYRDGQHRWRFAIVCGLFVGTLSILSLVNGSAPLVFQYPTELSYGAFLGIGLALIAFMAALFGAWIFLSAGAGEFLAGQLWPDSVRTLHQLLGGRCTRELAASTVRGYALGFGLLGYLVAFYTVGRVWFGMWVPAEGPHLNAINSRVVFLYPLIIALGAAVSEEVAYRLFAVSFVRRHCRSTFVAVLVPAIIWAFTHTGYGVEPVYARGIELTIAGVVLGYCFVRFDFWTVLIAHYMMDCLVVAVPFMNSSSGSFQVDGMIVLAAGLLPGILALLMLIRRPAEPRMPADALAGKSSKGDSFAP